jgi:hypothetical protein
MAQQKAIIDKLLTNASSMYTPEGSICDQILPVVKSVQKTGKLAQYGTDHLRIETSIIGGEGKYPRVNTQVRSSTSYSIEGHGLQGIVTEDDYSNVEKPYDAEADETIALSSKIMLEKEKALADALGSTSILTQNTTLSGSSQFSDHGSSDPIAKFLTARQAVKDGCGLPPNVAIMSWEVAEQLRYHPALLDSLGFKYNRPNGLTDQELASVLKVKRAYIGMVSYESANKGQTSSLSPVWGKNLIFAHIPDKAMKRQVSLGYCFKLAGRSARRVTKWKINNPPNSKAILVDDHYDFAITNVGAGYLIKDAVA